MAKIDLQGLAGNDALGKQLRQGLGPHLDQLNKLLPTMISRLSASGQLHVGVADLIDATLAGEMY